MKTHKWSELKRSAKDPIRAARVATRVRCSLFFQIVGALALWCVVPIVFLIVIWMWANGLPKETK